MNKLSTLPAIGLTAAVLLLLATVQTANAVWVEDVDTDIYPSTPTYSESGDPVDGPVYREEYTAATVEDNYYEDGWYINVCCEASLLVKPPQGQSNGLYSWLEAGIEIDRMWMWTGEGSSSGTFHWGCSIDSTLWVLGSVDSSPTGSAETGVYAHSDAEYGDWAYYFLWGEVENDSDGVGDTYIAGSPTDYSDGAPMSGWEFIRDTQWWTLEIEDSFSAGGLNVVYMDFASHADLYSGVTATSPEQGQAWAIAGGQVTGGIDTSQVLTFGEIWAYMD